ncbi:MAG: hypothetical protein ABFS10_13810 [Bacteroidota bacterium]
MSRTTLIAILIVFSPYLMAQKLDLIVTTNQDSIACRIDSISNDTYYFTAKLKGRKVSTHVAAASVADHQYDFIDKLYVDRVEGTTYFHTRTFNDTVSGRFAAYGTLSILPISGSTSFNFEYMIFNDPASAFKTVFLKGTTGARFSWEAAGPYFTGTFQAITGSGSHHFELGGGLAVLFGGIEPEYLRPAGSIGYRFNRPWSKFIFRGGVGYPEIVYISIGHFF